MAAKLGEKLGDKLGSKLINKLEIRAEGKSENKITNEIEKKIEKKIESKRESKIGSGQESGLEESVEESVRNQSLMQLIRRVHGIVDTSSPERQRQTQDSVASLLAARKDIIATDVDVDGMHGEWVRVAKMHMKRYVILYCHGGGYTTGSCLYARSLTYKLAENTNFEVFSFDYRLAPEHPYPAAAEDAMKAWNYLMLLGYGARDVIVAGDSAGGNMALSLVLRLKQEGRKLPKGLVLLSPWTDLTSSGKSHLTRAAVDPVLNAEYIEKSIQCYAEGQDLKDPLISPLFGDFTGFPPTLIQVGDNEILLSDSVALHKKMLKEDVNANIHIFKGMWHVFQMSPFKTANRAMEKCAEFIFELCS